MHAQNIRAMRYCQTIGLFSIAVRKSFVSSADKDRLPYLRERLKILKNLPVLSLSLGKSKSRIKNPVIHANL